MHKINPRRLTNLSVKGTFKTLKENMGGYLYDSRIGKVLILKPNVKNDARKQKSVNFVLKLRTWTYQENRKTAKLGENI